MVARRLSEQAVKLPHLGYACLAPAVGRDNTLDLLSKWLDALRCCGEVIKYMGHVLTRRKEGKNQRCLIGNGGRKRTVEEVWMAAKLTRNIRSTMLISEWFLRTASSMIHWSTSFLWQPVSECT